MLTDCAHSVSSSSLYIFFSSMSSLITPPPPTPTLFPYTTLFRSLLDKHAQRWKGGALAEEGLAARAIALCEAGRGEDRKSTRLNSSHLGISYAVFCLKKKKKNESSNR